MPAHTIAPSVSVQGTLVGNTLVTTFTVASNEFIGGGREKAEYHPVVTWV